MTVNSFCAFQSIGRTGAAPKIIHGAGGKLMALLKVSTSQEVRENSAVVEQTLWHSVIAFGKVAEYVRDSIPPGSRVYFEGSVYPGASKDKQGNITTRNLLVVSVISPLAAPYRAKQVTRPLPVNVPTVCKELTPVVEEFADSPF